MGGGEPSLLQLVRPTHPKGPERLSALRSADGSARRLRPASMFLRGPLLLHADARRPSGAPSRSGYRSLAMVATALALATGVSACGGGGSNSANTSGAPPLTVPTGASANAATVPSTTTSTTSSTPSTTTAAAATSAAPSS